MNTFETCLGAPLTSTDISVVQINVGLSCNLECHHCHVSSSPRRTEQMSKETMTLLLEQIAEVQPVLVDITGGSPEMNPHLQWFLSELTKRGQKTQVRTNLTIMLEDSYKHIPSFYAQHSIALVASLPCYLEENVRAQRGNGVYHESIDVLKILNSLGYGSTLPLTLVFNPGGPALPPNQKELEAAYRDYLCAEFDIVFSDLSTITNMPIGQFKIDLQKQGTLETYTALLKDSFNAATVDALMCRHQIHIAYDGSLHDCDFNYALKMGLVSDLPQNIRETTLQDIAKRPIVTAPHCFGCSAGAGSSCGGSLVT